MIKIALTGNIASGKSKAGEIIEKMGYKVADTDIINDNILKTDVSAQNEIKEAFKNYNITDNYNRIIKDKLAQVVFESNENKEKIEKILHKRILEKINEYFCANELENQVFILVPLLFEAKWEKYFDKIIFVSSEKELRLERLIKRNNYTEEYAKIRINSQENEDEKIKKSDYVIYNNSDFKSLENQVNEVISKLIRLDSV